MPEKLPRWCKPSMLRWKYSLCRLVEDRVHFITFIWRPIMIHEHYLITSHNTDGRRRYLIYIWGTVLFVHKFKCICIEHLSRDQEWVLAPLGQPASNLGGSGCSVARARYLEVLCSSRIAHSLLRAITVIVTAEKLLRCTNKHLMQYIRFLVAYIDNMIMENYFWRFIKKKFI
jgi:hypothetical protein